MSAPLAVGDGPAATPVPGAARHSWFEDAQALFTASLWPTLGAERPPVLLGLSERFLLAAYVAWLWAAADGTGLRRARDAV